MDPNGSFLIKEKSSESEANISPLHEPLRGMTTMPIMNDFVALNTPSPHSSSMGNTQPIIQAPEESTMMHIAQNRQEMLSRQEFLGNPIGNYFDSSYQMQILSMESPSFTSLLQGDPIALVHAHLNTIGKLDEGPIYEMPTRSVSEVSSLPHNSPLPSM